MSARLFHLSAPLQFVIPAMSSRALHNPAFGFRIHRWTKRSPEFDG